MRLEGVRARDLDWLEALVDIMIVMMLMLMITDDESLCDA